MPRESASLVRSRQSEPAARSRTALNTASPTPPASLTNGRANSPSKARGAAEAPNGQKLVNKVTTELEFGGPWGAASTMLLLPLVVIGLYAACGRHGCISTPTSVLEVLTSVELGPLWDWDAFAVVVGWTAIQCALYVLLPGPRVDGVMLRDGTRLKYPINAHLAFWLSLAGCVHGLPLLGISLSWLYDHYLQLATASCVLSTLLAAYSYVSSFVPGCMLADGGNSQNPVYDFFMGRPLNPRIGMLDLKVCCELRPGLIGWAVLNLGMAYKQYELHSSVSPSMLLVNAFQLLYVWDGLYNEQSILTTMDVTTDGFGFMLSFGDLAWVPFTYSLQVRTNLKGAVAGLRYLGERCRVRCFPRH
mmetsp:Transcript_13963/g.37827  ORF Transcript_13963/g.37827 Transcript_13963/m.37827 type:complete len:361 (-) Transcript_13963:827-1909(-)